MFDFFKTGAEFNKLAQSFNAMYLALVELTPKLERNKNDFTYFREEHKEDILVLAYIAKKGIIERLDKYPWGFEAKISIPTISSSRVTVGYAWSQTITKLNIIATLLNITEEVQEIIDGGALYIEFESSFPEKLKKW